MNPSPNPDDFEPHPDMDPPEMWCPTSWKGDWWLGTYYTPDPDGGEGERGCAWGREYLEHDGHEQCCGHSSYVFIEAVPRA